MAELTCKGCLDKEPGTFEMLITKKQIDEIAMLDLFSLKRVCKRCLVKKYIIFLNVKQK